MNKFFIGICTLFLCTTMVYISNAQAVTLYGVTGDGGTPSETLFELSLLDASSTQVLSLGNGDDGEACLASTIFPV